MRSKARKSCSNCRPFQAKLDAQEARLKVLEGTVARLQEQLAAARKNSSTSSRPPYSDIVKTPKPAPPECQQQRRIGKQPGHPKHEPFSRVREYVRDVLGVTISRGQSANIIAKVSKALEQRYRQLLESLPDQEWLTSTKTITGRIICGSELNLAEQAIRFVVIDLLITQGTRSEKGNRWCERIWTVIATSTQQRRSVFEYLEAAVGAWFAGTEPPLLLPGGLAQTGCRANSAKGRS